MQSITEKKKNLLNDQRSREQAAEMTDSVNKQLNTDDICELFFSEMKEK